MKICKTEQEYIQAIATDAQNACKKYGYLPSVLIAQACLENGYGIRDYWDNPEIELLMQHNNLLGMKASLLNASWSDKTVWSGKSFNKYTPEEYDGKPTIISDVFRAYDSVAQCFADYLLFMTYASNTVGGAPKYGTQVLNEKDPETLIKRVSSLGYATGSTYASNVMKIIQKHNLTQYDVLSSVPKTEQKYSIIDVTKQNLSQVPATRGSNKIEWIVVHYLGVPNADNENLYGGGYGGHYYVSRAGKIYKAADPRTAVVWHCGGGLQGSDGHAYHRICTNYNSIGIENGVCYTENVKDASGDSDKWYFTTETQEALVWLVSQLMDEYGIDIDHVIRHYDVTGKICPNPYVKNNKTRTSWTWDEFKTHLRNYRKGVNNMSKGIDISAWQETVDFKKVKADGVAFAILREGYRKATDARFFEYVKGCKGAGIYIPGVYHFIYAMNTADAAVEAQSCVKNVEKAGLPKSTVIWADLEYDTVTKAKKAGVTLTAKMQKDITYAFCEEIKRLGYPVGVYTNKDYLKNVYGTNLVNDYDIWMADYEASETPYPCVYQQTGSKGKVNGINGNVDMDRYVGYYTTNSANPKFKPQKQEEKPVVVKKSQREIYVNQMRAWVGKKESDGSFKVIIDTYNKGLADAVKRWGTRNVRMDYSWAWCACTVSSAGMACGLANIIPVEISCYYMIEIAKKHGIWVESDSYVPKMGDLILYDWNDSGSGDNQGTPDHIGVVELCDGKTITVIEGNKSNSVSRRTLNVNGRYIRGFIVPKFGETEEVVTPTVKKTVEELAKEVLEGKWGNGDDRKNRLTSAGYDYNAVQARVNELVKGETQSMPQKTVDELAKEVLQGKWGNGDARKKALTDAGYDYSAVQSRVNQLVKGNTQKEEVKPTQTVKEVTATAYATGFNASLAGAYRVTTALNMRNGGSLQYKVLKVLPENAVVRCYGYFTDSNGTRWLYVQTTLGGVKYTGFCSSKYLKKQ